MNERKEEELQAKVTQERKGCRSQRARGPELSRGDTKVGVGVGLGGEPAAQKGGRVSLRAPGGGSLGKGAELLLRRRRAQLIGRPGARAPPLGE